MSRSSPPPTTTVHYTYRYDDVGRPIEVNDLVSSETQMRSYHSLGGIEHEILGNNLMIQRSFDEQGEPYASHYRTTLMLHMNMMLPV